MSNSEFEMLVVCYLEGTATQDQVIRLRNAIKSSEDMKRRFHARVRLYQAQVAFLSQRQEKSAPWVMAWLSRFAQRFGRPLAHLCLLALVFVELRVRIPAEYSGLLFYVEEIVEEQDTNYEDMPTKLMLSEVANADLEMPTSDMPDPMSMPNFVMPEVVVPVDESIINEA
jgi:hypothetical protein